MQISRLRRLSPVVLLAVIPMLSGCWSFHPSTRPQVVGKVSGPEMELWPTRDIEPLKQILEETPSVLPRYAMRSDVDPATLSEQEKQILETTKETVLYKGIHGRSLLRIFSWKPQPRISQATNDMARLNELLGPGFPANARTLSSRTISSAADAATLETKLQVTPPKMPTLYINPPSKPVDAEATKKLPGASRPKIMPTALESKYWIDSGKPIRIPPPKKAGEYRGLILHFQAIAYNEYEPKVLEEFERRGWAVIDISTESSTLPPLSDAEIEQYRAAQKKAYDILEKIYADQAAAFPKDKAPAADAPDIDRYTQKFFDYSRKHPLYKDYLAAFNEAGKMRLGSFQACPDANLDEIASQIALRADQALAGNCYAAETCLDYALTQRPDLQNIPIVMIGFSAGALTTPTAAAYLRDHLDAVVTIGGAANIFLVTQESVFTDGGIRVRCGKEKVSKQTIAALSELYLKHSHLDPYHTAPMIAHLPILEVHASMDDWVPADLGDILFERLGKPDRLTITAGHELLFYFLPNRAKFIADWVEKHVSHEASHPPLNASAQR